jgi:hypothetical protein
MSAMAGLMPGHLLLPSKRHRPRRRMIQYSPQAIPDAPPLRGMTTKGILIPLKTEAR